MSLKQSIRRILKEEDKLYATPQQLVKNLPDELKKLLFKQWGAKQNPEWHPEGNTQHILVVLKRAYHHYPDDPNMVMAALFHDLGKMDTYSINPKTNQPTAYGHEDKSTDYVEQFRNWIDSFDGTDVDEIKYLVKNHMKVKPRTWDQMKDKKKEPIKSHPAFDKLMGFTDKLDGGGVDLQESIRRILKEEIDLLSIRRRFFIVDDYIQNLDPKDVCIYWPMRIDVVNYVNETMSDIVRIMLTSIRGVNADNYHDTYEEIYEMLIDLGYKKKIEDFFFDSLDNCYEIIKESTLTVDRKEKIQKLIDNEIDLMKNICEYMDSENEEEFISFDACDFLELDPKVKVTAVDKLNGIPRILVVIKYEAMMHFHDEETFISELQYRLRKWISNVTVDVEDVINTYPNEKRQW